MVGSGKHGDDGFGSRPRARGADAVVLVHANDLGAAICRELTAPRQKAWGAERANAREIEAVLDGSAIAAVTPRPGGQRRDHASRLEARTAVTRSRWARPRGRTVGLTGMASGRGGCACAEGGRSPAAGGRP